MKMILTIWCAVLALLTMGFSTSDTPSEAELPSKNYTTVMSYNIDLENSPETVSWKSRRNVIAQIIRTKSPEILGLQESTPSQTNWLLQNTEGYECYAVGSDDLSYQQEMCPILYESSKFTRLDEGSFWLPAAETKSDPSSKTVNWLTLLHKGTGKKLHVFNTQFLNGDKDFQKSSARLLKERIDGITDGGTFIILGNLNFEPDSEPMSWITTWAKDSQESCLLHTSSTDKTFFGWKKDPEIAKRLDYVLFSKDIPANSHEIVDLRYKGSYPSDHLPVYCRLRFQ